MKRKSLLWIILLGTSILLLACSLPLVNDKSVDEPESQPPTAEPLVEEPQSDTLEEQPAGEAEEPSPAEGSQEPAAIETDGGMSIDPLILSTDQGVWLYDEISAELSQLSPLHLDALRNLSAGLSQDKQTFAYLTGLEESSNKS